MSDRPFPILAGLIGWPVHQSKSPLIHDHWLRATGVDGNYIRLPVKPGEVEAALASLVQLGFAGVQATMPHKRDCFRAVDRLTPTAKAIGAVNTIVFEADGQLLGHNTDMAGFVEPLAAHDLSGKAATVLGAGGAAAAILVGLAQKSVSHIYLVNRSASGIDTLLRDVGDALGSVEVITGDWKDADRFSGQSALVVNATSLGMAGQSELPLQVSSLAGDAIAYDIVTHPHNTAFLNSARARGLVCYDGFHMLIGQAREGFSLFFGAHPPEALDADIRKALISG